MLSKAEGMQCSHSTLMTDNEVECKNSPSPSGYTALLITHLEQLNLILRALIEKLSDSTGANFKYKQALAGRKFNFHGQPS